MNTRFFDFKVFLICRRARQVIAVANLRDKCEKYTLYLAVQVEKPREIPTSHSENPNQPLIGGLVTIAYSLVFVLALHQQKKIAWERLPEPNFKNGLVKKMHNSQGPDSIAPPSFAC